MNDSISETFGTRAKRAIKRFVITVSVLGLGGAVVVLLSQANARTYSLQVADGKLVVLKGRLMPAGAEPWRPSDPTLADAYAPLELEGLDPSHLHERKFTERDELDRAMFGVLETLARPRVASDDPEKLERGLYFLRRAEKLTGLTDEQRLSLKALKSEVAFYQARGRLEDAQRLVTEAMAQLRLAASGQSRHARSANQMISAVEPQAQALEESLRKALNELSAPPEPMPTPVPAEPPPNTAPTETPPAAGAPGEAAAPPEIP